MIKKFINKQVSLKIALFTSSLLLVATLIFAVVFQQFDASLLNIKNAVGLFVLFSLFFVFLQTTLVIISSSLFINKPLQKLVQTMQKVKEGRLNEKCPIGSEDEFGELSHSFNDMIVGLNDINENRKHIQQRLIKAEESLKFKLELEEKAKIIERMNKELTGAFNDVSLLYTVSQYLNSILELDQLIISVEKIFKEKFVCDRFAFYFVNSDTDKVRLVAQKGLKESKAYIGQEIGGIEGIAGKTLKRRRSFYINDLSLNTGMQRSQFESEFEGAVFSVPLMVRDEMIGLLIVSRDQKNSFSPTDRQSLDSIASQIAVAYDRSQLYTQTKEMSVRDELTGAFNRRHFHQMLKLEFKRAQRFNRQVSLLMIDMDHFKAFNDTHGHLKGDELLKRLTELLNKSVREVDLVARFGGEEFVIMLTNTSLTDAVKVANKLRKIIKSQLKQYFEDLDHDRIGLDSDLTVSIGVSAYPDCALNPNDLINTADMALYMAKRDGRDLVRQYQTSTLPLEELMA